MPDGDTDHVYFAVERNGHVCIEQLAEREYAEIKDAFFVDSGVEKVSETPFDTLEGLEHLEGKTLAILADGAVQQSRTVEDGTIKLKYPAKKVIAGLPYVSELEPMPAEAETENGQTLLRNKIIGEVRVRVYKSVGGELCCGSDQWQKIIARDVLSDDMDRAIHSKDEVVRLNVLSGYSSETSIRIRQTDPLPFNITAIVSLYDIGDKI